MALPLAIVAGCSIPLTRGPLTPTIPNDCTSSHVVPALDVTAVLAIVGASYVLASLNDYDCGTVEHEKCGGFHRKVFLEGLAVAVPFGVSAGIGFHRVSECRDAQ